MKVGYTIIIINKINYSIMKRALVLTLILALSATALAKDKKPVPPTPAPVPEEVVPADGYNTPVFYIEGFRGLWVGLEKGLFKTADTGAMCLNDKISEKVIKVVEAIVDLDFTKLQGMLSDIMEIGMNLSQCSFDGFVKVFDYCFEDAENCGPNKLMANIQKNMFVIMGKFTDVANIIKEFPPVHAAELHDEIYAIGEDLGTLARVILGYETKTSPKKKFFGLF
jgi:hypothetical protein